MVLASPGAHLRVECTEQANAVDGMDGMDQGKGALDLVALQMADEVPSRRGNCLRLPPKFLRPVLTKVENAQLRQSRGGLESNGFCDRDQGHCFTAPSDAGAGSAQPLLHRIETCTDGLG